MSSLSQIAILWAIFAVCFAPASFAAKKKKSSKGDVVVAFVARKNDKDLETLMKLCRKHQLPENFDENWNSLVNRGSPQDIKLLSYVHDHCSNEKLSEIDIELEGPLLYKHPEILFDMLAKRVHRKSDLDFNQLASDLNMQVSNFATSKDLGKSDLLKKLGEPQLSGDGKRLQELVLNQISATYDRK